MYTFRHSVFITARCAILVGALVLTRMAVAQAETGKQTGPEVSPADRVAAIDAVLNIAVAYRQWNEAVSRKDTNALIEWVGRYSTSDYSLRKLDGSTENCQAFQASLKRNLALRKTINKLTVKGDTAIGLVSQSSPESVTDPKGQTNEKSQQRTQRETWTKTPQGWRIKSSEELADSKK